VFRGGVHRLWLCGVLQVPTLGEGMNGWGAKSTTWPFGL
jgi:hypothetical protein